ncbi:MAG TPA: acyltransferase [Streptosporangiaceae bacterium]|nr:acyltransferase [Streptosporangiaceae bacterium]
MIAAPPAPAPTARREPATPAARTRRLAWLDALRGLAALCVVYQHFGARVFPGLHAAVISVFDPGLYGVLLFFLISGYVVPRSLERTGSVRAFWIGRLFRLFPLFGFVILILLLLHAFGLASLNGTNQNVAAAVFSHLFMLSDLLGGPNLIVVIWTLSYEMVFYLLLTALFTVGLHRRSGELAAVFGTGALVLGGLLPTAWLTYHSLGLTRVALIADCLIIGGLAVALCGRGLLRALGAWLAACTALVLVALNGNKSGYEGLTILALMFTGTVLYRAQQGQIKRGPAAAIVAGTFAATIAAGVWSIPGLGARELSALDQREWVVSVALAGLTFAAGLALQNLRVPSLFSWLGLVSYSVYLGLPLMLDLYDDIPFPQNYRHLAWLQAGASMAFVAALLSFAAVSYYLVETPLQRLGKRAAIRLDPGLAMARSQPASAAPGPGLARGPGRTAGLYSDRRRQLHAVTPAMSWSMTSIISARARAWSAASATYRAASSPAPISTCARGRTGCARIRPSSIPWDRSSCTSPNTCRWHTARQCVQPRTDGPSMRATR